MKLHIFSVLMVTAHLTFGGSLQELPARFSISKAELQDKIKGGWAGQTIGVTYGGPTEFKYLGRVIEDQVEIPWRDDYVEWYFNYHPGLYDDIYMDLSFVEVIERLGIDAPIDSFAQSFANAGFKLWHANQAARYNIQNGTLPPESGHWKNNLHASCIDFQIEADFAGLMSPGMINTSAAICDKIGHIMNYGDGWYGGVFVASMYSLAFISSDIEFIVNEALKSIPEESNYYKCMAQVLEWHKKYPDDWKKAWFEIEQANWEEYCPKGVHRAFNIEATVNSAYVLLGLLYGGGDFGKTMEIATRSGQDSDCNPATCAGILGVILGYQNIPEYWLKPLQKVENIKFDHTSMSLNDTYNIGLKHALQTIKDNGGIVTDNNVTIQVQKPIAVKLEQIPDFEVFKDVFGQYRYSIVPENNGVSIRDFQPYQFTGSGIAITGLVKEVKPASSDYIAEVEYLVDNKHVKTMKLPLNFIERSVDLFWLFDLPNTSHTLEINWLNPDSAVDVVFENAVVYRNNKILNK